MGGENEISSVSAVDKNFGITANDIGKATLMDLVLNRVLGLVMPGWPEKCDEENLKPDLAQVVERKQNKQKHIRI